MGAADKFVDDPKVEFAAVDCTAYQTLCSQNDVSGYPTFKYFNYFKNTKPYNGGRTVSVWYFFSFYYFSTNLFWWWFVTLYAWSFINSIARSGSIYHNQAT